MEMNNPNEARNKAREMLIAGEDWDKVREATNLRLKDVKRIQKDISEHF